MIINNFSKMWDWFSKTPQKRLGVRTLQIALGVVFLFRAFTELPFAQYLYGFHGIGDNQSQNSVYQRVFGYSALPLLQYNFFIYLILLLLAFCGICFIVNYKTHLTTLISLFVFNILTSLNAALGDGGDNVTQLILIYMLLLIPIYKTFEEDSIRVWLHNLGIVAIGAQIMILYFTAGFMKISGETWTNGTALFEVSQVEAFSLPWIREIFKNPYISTISAYTTMIFLIWFPIAMFSKLKYLWIFIGITFHLGIFGFMGLVTFAITMIGMELFFIGDEEYLKINAFLKNLLKRLQTNSFWNLFNTKLTFKNNNPSNS